MAEATTSSASEFEVAKKWDLASENMIRKTAKGALFAVLPALLLLRRPVTRVAAVAFAGGIGAGIGYTEAKYAFETGFPKIDQE
ncbi:mitochondrial MICOS protein Mic10 [Andalucia godoyi]|uniref:Mitochondrial MICOS protein Mic10 n=1 Tax=Andalucia godoyi TaxID=505711 RepID=A0A8K0AGQ5_ANDGO|nr:mitochondrial MICOS protein Mic10 [Andalucia godoyi]|eukprot:ANDGO_01280.mRNA.1 mitochondrial MICOS protein Mic10